MIAGRSRLASTLPGQETDLHDLGLRDTTDLEGGFAAWQAAGLPVVSPAGRCVTPTWW